MMNFEELTGIRLKACTKSTDRAGSINVTPSNFDETRLNGRNRLRRIVCLETRGVTKLVGYLSL
ncbi:MAG: hypothetical protein E5V73_00405 [Mesorhizobium sp.]|nr:MAG: hypothetical protein E5V73_00405 [Mesorhizobium sp.]